MKLAVKSWLSSIPAEWRWTLQRLWGVLAAPGTKHSSRKTDFSYSLPKRETQTSITVGTRAGFWYPVALPWDQRFCALFSHIQKGKMHMNCFKKTQTNKKHNYFHFTLSRQQEIRVKHHQDLVLGLQAPAYQFSTTTSQTQLDQLQSPLRKLSLEFISQITARN